MHNLSKIMRRAWEIKRKDKRNIFALCLKMAWDEAKLENLVESLKEMKIVLNGSEKQIRWAKDIFNNVIERIYAFLNKRIKKSRTGIMMVCGLETHHRVPIADVVFAIKEEFSNRNHTRASYWIDTRSRCAEEIVAFAYENVFCGGNWA